MSMMWVGIGSAVLGAGSTMYAASQQPGAPPPRNLGNELGSISSQYPGVLNNFMGGNAGFTNNSMGNIGTLMRGNPYMDSSQYYNNMSDADKANIDKMGQDQGVSGIDWLNGHFMDTMNKGDPVAKQMFSQYGGYTGGLLDATQGINSATRGSNMQDVANLAPSYTNIMRGANQDYYNSLNAYSNAAGGPIQQSQSQQQAAQQAGQGYGTFNPSGMYANTNFGFQGVNAPQGMMSVNAQRGNPLLSQMNQQASNFGPSGLQQQQNTLASQLMDQGGQLSPSELRNVQQGSRAGFAARGLDASNASIVDEVMQTDAAQRARLTQNLGLAQGVQNQGLAESGQQQQFGLGVGSQNFGYGQMGLQGQMANQGAYQNLNSLNMQGQLANQQAGLQTQNMGLQAQQANQQFGLGAFGANLQSQQMQQQALMQSAQLAEQQRQFQLANMGQAAQMQGQHYLDPYGSIMQGADTNLLGQILGTNQANQSQQGSLYSSLLGYGQDLSNTNYNANAASNIAGYNSQQALYGGLTSMAGRMGGAAISNYQG